MQEEILFMALSYTSIINNHLSRYNGEGVEEFSPFPTPLNIEIQTNLRKEMVTKLLTALRVVVKLLEDTTR